MIQKLSDWVRNNIDTDLIINLTCDPDILGGLQISYNGQYFDEGLRRKLEEVSDENYLNSSKRFARIFNSLHHLVYVIQCLSIKH